MTNDLDIWKQDLPQKLEVRNDPEKFKKTSHDRIEFYTQMLNRKGFYIVNDNKILLTRDYIMAHCNDDGHLAYSFRNLDFSKKSIWVISNQSEIEGFESLAEMDHDLYKEIKLNKKGVTE